ncbi:hypothetical protein [Pseudaminobacter sp. NGMCC 1.201702]|uniref:hypothetical protein n=1 Tax=Pseudaminobacter sp. NGMCC 1.201702 TaxID=3391825 RepID=UPI0039F10568
MATLLTIFVVLRLLLASFGVVVFVALLPSFDMLLVGSASVWHDASPSWIYALRLSTPREFNPSEKKAFPHETLRSRKRFGAFKCSRPVENWRAPTPESIASSACLLT